MLTDASLVEIRFGEYDMIINYYMLNSNAVYHSTIYSTGQNGSGTGIGGRGLIED